MNKQARVELADIYGKEFDTELFAGAVEETDELLNDKVAAMAEKIEVDKNIDIDERRR